MTRTKRRPATTWDHVAKWQHRRAGDNNPPPEVEAKPFTCTRGGSSMGRTWVRTRCPFCDWQLALYVWSLSGGGKRCDNKQCGAIFGSSGDAFRLVCT